MVYTYVAGPAREAESKAAVHLRQAASEAMAARNARIAEAQGTPRRSPAGSVHSPLQGQTYGAVWSKSVQDYSPVVTLNSVSAPGWASALDIGRQVTAGNPLPGANHAPFQVDEDAQPTVGHDRRLYQPPVQLVVLDSQLRRLGPSTPFRYTAAMAPQVDHQHLQQPLLSPVVAPRGTSMRWAADTGTQTTPEWLAADAERLGEGSTVSKGWAAGALLSSQYQQQTVGSKGRPYSAGRVLDRSGRQCGSSHSPWRLMSNSRQQQQGGDNAGVGSEPWIPAGIAEDPVADEVTAASARVWESKQASGPAHVDCAAAGGPALAASALQHRRRASSSDGCGDWRAYSPTSRRKAAQRAHEKARHQVEVSTRYAKIGRTAARENAAAAAALVGRLQQKQPDRPAAPKSSSRVAGAVRSIPAHPGPGYKHGSNHKPKPWKTVPPPSQPWKPARAVNNTPHKLHGSQQQQQLHTDQHALPPTSQEKPGKSGINPDCASPRTLRQLINRTKQRARPTSAQDVSWLHIPATGVDRSTQPLSAGADAGNGRNHGAVRVLHDAVFQQLHPELAEAWAAIAAADDGNAAAFRAKELADVQALLDETLTRSAEQVYGSEESWQLSTAPHLPDAATVKPHVAQHSHSVLPSDAAAVPVQQHEDEPPAALESPRALTASDFSRIATLGSQSADHTPCIQPNTAPQLKRPDSPGLRYDRVQLHRVPKQPGSPLVHHDAIMSGSPTHRPASPGVRYDRLNLSRPVQKASTAAVPAASLHTVAAAKEAAQNFERLQATELGAGIGSSTNSYMRDLALALDEAAAYDAVIRSSIAEIVGASLSASAAADTQSQRLGSAPASATVMAGTSLITNTTQSQLAEVLGPELAALVLEPAATSAAAAAATDGSGDVFIRFPRLTQPGILPAEQPEDANEGLSRQQAAAQFSLEHSAAAPAGSAVGALSNSGSRHHMVSVSGHLAPQSSTSSSGGSSHVSVPGVELTEDDLGFMTLEEQLALAAAASRSTDLTLPAASLQYIIQEQAAGIESLQRPPESFSQHECHQSVSGDLVRSHPVRISSMTVSSVDGNDADISNSNSRSRISRDSHTGDHQGHGVYLAEISESDAEFLELEEQLEIAAAAAQAAAHRLQPLQLT